jgi:hypothetical protein
MTRHNLHVLSVSALERRLAEAVDAAERARSNYVGAATIDPGNPILTHVLWRLLIHDCDYVQGCLTLWQEYEDTDGRWDLRGDHWWNRLGFTRVCWSAPTERNEEVPTLTSTADSLRGRFSRALLETRAKPSLQQMVVDALRHQTAGLDQSTVPAKFEASFLPGADIPEVEELKLARYALNPGHEKGRHKAALFEMLLGIGVRDWKHLAAQLRSGLAGATIDSVDFTPYGVKYRARIPIEGTNGRVLPVQTVWEIRPGGHPRLVTCYPAEVAAVVTQDPVARPSLVDTRASSVDWSVIWDRAISVARVAAERMIPTPLVVGEVWYADGAIGFAWVRVLDARTGFARWLRTTGNGSDGYKSGSYVFARGVGQSHDRARAWGWAFAAVLCDHGIRCEVGDRYD